MARQSGKKIFAGREAMFLFGNKLITGHASNLSRNGMLIHAKLEFPFKLRENFHVLMFYKNKRLLVPVKIRNFIRMGNCCKAISVEVRNPHTEYLKLVKEQNSYSQSFSYFMKRHSGHNLSTPY